jgi:hypothetical protein
MRVGHLKLNNLNLFNLGLCPLLEVVENIKRKALGVFVLER